MILKVTQGKVSCEWIVQASCRGPEHCYYSYNVLASARGLGTTNLLTSG